MRGGNYAAVISGRPLARSLAMAACYASSPPPPPRVRRRASENDPRTTGRRLAAPVGVRRRSRCERGALPKPRVLVYHERGDNLPLVIGSKRSRAGVMRIDIRVPGDPRQWGYRRESSRFAFVRGLCLSLPIDDYIADPRPRMDKSRRISKMTRSRRHRGMRKLR